MNESEFKTILKVSENEKGKCYRCDGNHSAKSCPFIDEKCFCCHKKCHTSRVYQKKAILNLGRVLQTNQVDNKSNTS